MTVGSAGFVNLSAGANDLPNSTSGSAQQNPESPSGGEGEDAAVSMIRIAEPLIEAYPHLKSTMEWDRENRNLKVHLVDDPAYSAERADVISSVSAKLSPVADKSGVTFSFPQSKFSVAEIQAATKGLFANDESWAGDRKSTITGGTSDPVTGQITIGVTEDSAGLRDQAQRFIDGKRWADPKRQDVPAVLIRMRVTEPAKPLAGRYSDTSPWTAGNAIWWAGQSRAQAFCTQGWTWRKWSNNRLYASTAGHCGGTNWYHHSTTARFGYNAGAWKTNGGNIDFQLIYLTFGALDSSVWVNTSLRNTASAYNGETASNITVCASGANSYSQCGTIVDPLATVHYVDGSYLYNQTCLNGGTLIGGDSGGPALRTFSNGEADAWGVIVGGGGPCSWHYTKVRYVSSQVGASLHTT